MKKQTVFAALFGALLMALAIETYYIYRLTRPEAPSRSSQAEKDPSWRRASDPYWMRPIYEEWDPFQEMDEIQAMMNRLFRDSYRRGLRSGEAPERVFSYHPDLDVSESEDEYLLRMDLPGLDKDTVSVRAQGGVLTISGERRVEQEANPAKGVYRLERSFGTFTRSIPLPPDADTAAMRVESQKGVLTVRIPKAAKARGAA
jgi:HSP20 family protein